jgi:sensor histidine kinase YesM
MKDAADYLYIFANLIAKMGVANVVQTQLLNETREKMKLQQLVKDTNLKSLQSQINPHFLFNTLNTIARMALIENAPKTEELMYALSDILRYSLRNSDNLVTIETEINNIKKYLFIQYTRYNDRLKYEINISPKIMDFKIPVMTLQPIVENAIIHGLENKKEGGEIIISGNLVLNKFIILEIYDNGIGIDEKKLKLINEGTKSYDSSTGLGICNVSDRIKHYFGNNYGLEVKSKLNEGTTVTIKIPSIL